MKIGTRVKIIGRIHEFSVDRQYEFVGQLGKIVEVDPSNEFLYLVHLDLGHTHTYWLRDEDVKEAEAMDEIMQIHQGKMYFNPKAVQKMVIDGTL